jgi:hypothetical protein
MSRETITSGAVGNTAENLRLWVRNPAALKPGCLMPSTTSPLLRATTGHWKPYSLIEPAMRSTAASFFLGLHFFHINSRFHSSTVMLYEIAQLVILSIVRMMTVSKLHPQNVSYPTCDVTLGSGRNGLFA